MKTRITVYLILACLVLSVFGILELIKDNHDLYNNLEHQAAGIRLIFNDEIYAGTSSKSGFCVGGGFSCDMTDSPDKWIILKKIDFKITHIH